MSFFLRFLRAADLSTLLTRFIGGLAKVGDPVSNSSAKGS